MDMKLSMRALLDPELRPRWLRGRVRTSIVVVLAVVLVVGVGALIGKATEYAALLDHLAEARPGWFALCLGGMVLSYAGYVLAYRDAARVHGGPVLDLRRCLEVVVAGVGAMVAASGAGGLAVHYWAFTRAGSPPHEAVRRVLAINTLNWASLGLASAAAALILIAGAGADVPLGATLPWAIGVPLCALAAAWVSSPRRRDRLTRTQGVSRPRQVLADAIGGVVLVRAIVCRPQRYVAGVVGFPIFWLGHLLCLYGGLRAFGGSIGPAELVLGYATGYVASALPLPAGGAGGIDAAMTFALTMVGVPLATALLGVFAYRLFTFWLPLVPALIIVPRLSRLHRELPGVARDPREPAPATP
jgi:uncharacterized membrane protein YbhN (UPF0104 family)